MCREEEVNTRKYTVIEAKINTGITAESVEERRVNQQGSAYHGAARFK